MWIKASVHKSFGFFVSCYKVPTSNPFLIHGTFKLPANLFSSSDANGVVHTSLGAALGAAPGKRH